VSPPGPRLRRVGGIWLAEGAVLGGDVRVGADTSLWFGTVVRGDDAPIEIGERTNVQDNTVVHVDPDAPHAIGSEVTIGHGAICHGIRIGDHALIGMGAILLSGSVVGEGAVVGAGTVVPEDFEVPPFTLVVGVPARIVRTLDREARLKDARWKAEGYVARARQYETGGWDGRVVV